MTGLRESERISTALAPTIRVFITQAGDRSDYEALLKDLLKGCGLQYNRIAARILPILLLESERPLLIDQPEDNLDNAFVYDTIVKSLRNAKGGRQLIFVTHNPNIPVLGEADRVFVFASDGRQGTVTHRGTVEDVKEQIEHLLEGGKEAFVLRMHKYGH